MKWLFGVQNNEAYNSFQARKGSKWEGAEAWHAAKSARIIELAEAAGVASIPRISTTTDILKLLSVDENLTRFEPLTTWQICSGMAHGKIWASLKINDLEAISHDIEAKESVTRVTISYSALAVYTRNALGLASAALDLFDRQRTRHRP